MKKINACKTIKTIQTIKCYKDHSGMSLLFCLLEKDKVQNSSTIVVNRNN